ncbi:hypothetical protein ACJIZ3_008593 [Penstemon smallii]|uniref:Uncharacterized protein n=1 Tax=Penstemon smallii TaxID=265156 RepID=A0ABD3TBY0_9LAMI
MTATVGGKKICVSAAVLSELYGLKNEGGDVTELGAEKEEEFLEMATRNLNIGHPLLEMARQAVSNKFKGRISRVDIKGEPVVAQHKHTSID